MKFQALVTSLDGKPVAQASASIVDVDGKRSEGKVDQGALVIEAEPGPTWGLEIDGKPVIAIVASATRELVLLGEVALVPAGLGWPVFHAKAGIVFGVPRAALGLGATKPGEPVSAPPPVAPAAKSGATFGTLLGSAAQQLNKASLARTGLKLRGASVTVKGLPITSGDALGLEFPTADIVGAGAGLSEVSFSLEPEPGVALDEPKPRGVNVPDLAGYTLPFASRKLAALGLFADATTEIVSDATRDGCIVRQLPRAGESVAPAAVIRVFVGKSGPR